MIFNPSIFEIIKDIIITSIFVNIVPLIIIISNVVLNSQTDIKNLNYLLGLLILIIIISSMMIASTYVGDKEDGPGDGAPILLGFVSIASIIITVLFSFINILLHYFS